MRFWIAVAGHQSVILSDEQRGPGKFPIAVDLSIRRRYIAPPQDKEGDTSAVLFCAMREDVVDMHGRNVALATALFRMGRHL